MTEKIKLEKPVQNGHGWYVGVEGDDYQYLNSDGAIQEGVSLYFGTEAEALAAIAKFQSANQ